MKILKDFIKNFNLPIDEKKFLDLEYLKFSKDSKEYKYLVNQRKKLGGFLPKRQAAQMQT